MHVLLIFSGVRYLYCTTGFPWLGHSEWVHDLLTVNTWSLSDRTYSLSPDGRDSLIRSMTRSLSRWLHFLYTLPTTPLWWTDDTYALSCVGKCDWYGIHLIDIAETSKSNNSRKGYSCIITCKMNLLPDKLQQIHLNFLTPNKFVFVLFVAYSD